MMRLTLVKIWVSAFMLFLGMSVQAHASKIIKVSLVQYEGDPIVKAMREVFKPMVEEKTNGEYKVEIYCGGALGNGDTVFQGLQFGTIQMALESTSNLSPFIPELAVFDLPYIFPTLKSSVDAMNTPIGKELENLFAKKRVLPLKYIPVSFRDIITSVPVNSLDDVQGLKFRTTSSKNHILSVKSFGMAPTPMPVTEMLTGLQQGVVKGLDCDLNFYLMCNYIDFAPNIFMADYAPILYIVYTSEKWFNHLPNNVKSIIHDALSAFEAKANADIEERIQNGLKDLVEKKGLKIVVPSKEEKARWVEKGSEALQEVPDNIRRFAEEFRKAAWDMR